MDENFNPRNILNRFKGLFSIGLSDVVAGIITSLFWLYVASIIDVDQYGEIFYIFAIGNIAISLSLLGSENALMVYTPKNIKISSGLFLLVIIISLILSSLTLIIFSNTSLGIYVFGGVIFALSSTELLAKKLYQNYFIYQIIQKIMMVFFALLLYTIFEINGIVLGVALSFFVYLIIIVKEIKSVKINLSLVKNQWKFLLYSYGQKLSATFSNQIDKLIIGPFLGFTLLGNYQLGIQFIAIFQIFPLIMLKYTLPHDASGTKNKNLKIVMFLLSIFFTLSIIVISPYVIPIFFNKFVLVVDIIQILSISLIPMTFNTILSSKFLADEKSKIIFIAMVLLIISHTIGIFLLSESLGAIGVAISYNIAMTIQSFFYTLIYFKERIKTA